MEKIYEYGHGLTMAAIYGDVRRSGHTISGGPVVETALTGVSWRIDGVEVSRDGWRSGGWWEDTPPKQALRILFPDRDAEELYEQLQSSWPEGSEEERATWRQMAHLSRTEGTA